MYCITNMQRDLEHCSQRNEDTFLVGLLWMSPEQSYFTEHRVSQYNDGNCQGWLFFPFNNLLSIYFRINLLLPLTVYFGESLFFSFKLIWLKTDQIYMYIYGIYIYYVTHMQHIYRLLKADQLQINSIYMELIYYI